MTKAELLEFFSTFTREDWKQMEAIKNIAFQPTPEELEAQRLEQEQYRKTLINEKLSNVWVSRPQTITKEFVILLLTQLNAQQFIWDDFETWVSNQEVLFWSLDKAFDDLVLRYL